MEAKFHPLVNSGKDGGAANVGTRIFEMRPLKQQVSPANVRQGRLQNSARFEEVLTSEVI